MSGVGPVESADHVAGAPERSASGPAWQQALHRVGGHAHRSAHASAHHAHAAHHHHIVHLASHGQHDRNIHDLARIITAEAGGEDQATMAAVGWTVRNRMARAGTSHVEDVWSGYARSRHGSAAARDVAERIMDGEASDPTAGATHFYSPASMPKEGQPPGRDDVSGGLEQVPGVDAPDGRQVRNYRPGWAAPGQFEPCQVAGVASHVFKFFRQPGSGHVR